MQDNSDAASSFTSPVVILSAYDKIDFKFFFASRDYEADEDFFIEFRENYTTGAWINVATFKAGNITSTGQGDFLRDDVSSGNFYSKTVTLLASNYSFNPIGSQFRIRSDASYDDDDIYVDMITITGTTFNTPTTGPGGVTSNLNLWLRSDKLDGSTVGTDGANVNTWVDNGKGNNATTNVPGQEPVYRNNATDNFNFNPVIKFENDYNTAGRDLNYINTRDELSSSNGFNSNDIFIVLVPDYSITNSMYPMDTFTGHDPTEALYSEDVTGIGFGDYSQRFSGEYFAYAQGTSSGTGIGYGEADNSGSTDFTQVAIYNPRHNASNTGMEIYRNGNLATNSTSDPSDFTPINNSKFWIGRSQHFNGSFGGRIAEIITFDSRKTDGASERRRIESYLALKYGITLGTNGTAMDYVDSDGNVVWDASANAGFNYDIAGIFRDDASNHQQKQSKSLNSSSVVTIGHKDINLTNYDNSNNFDNDKDYLVWGHNNAALSGSNTISINLGSSSTAVTTMFDRRWKIEESGSDIQDVKISIPASILPAKAANEEYALVVSSTSTFGSSDIIDVIPMFTNGSNIETWYDFDNSRYFTFGIASRVSGKYNVEFASGDFLVGEDSVNLNSNYTVSAWVRNLGNGGNYVSKGTAYNFEILSTGRIRANINGVNYAQSATSISDNNWHHVAYTYSAGTLRLYIDGVEDGNSPISGVANPIVTTDHFAIGVNYSNKNSISSSFDGNIDEVRVWDTQLSQIQIQYIMNQEVENQSGSVAGTIVPQTITRNEVAIIPWNTIQAYHNINEFYGTTVVDGSGHNNWLRIKYLVTGKNIIGNQTAPLPYESNTNGDWDTAATWLNGSETYIPGSASIVDSNITIDWNIVRVNNDVTMDNSSLPLTNNENRTLLGLYTTASNKLTINNDSGLTVTHHLELNGDIDLQGESQLIQSNNSVITVGINGSLERDQQGTADRYTYNYWSSPVGFTNVTATNSTYKSRFTVPNVLRDGTNPLSPQTINFITSGYNGTNTNPIGLADYWIWKFADQPDDDYSAWQHVRSTGTIQPGEGFTMKGPGTGTIGTDQNYVFVGKPNNGDITLTISSDNDYLIGNPYPSAIDAHEFLNDNPITNGTLYFWEHWGGGSHNLSDYQGGYATYNYSGGIPAASYGTNDPDVATGGTPTKMPERYIPVSQGFFVYSATGGTLRFENDQRIFAKESSGASTFFRTNNQNTTPPVNYYEDDRMKFRIGINSVNQIHRQLLLTVDENASPSVDWGYDGILNEQQLDDMYWMIDNNKYGIQGINEVTEQTILPLGVKVSDNGTNHITIDHLENVPEALEIYVHDNELNVYHNLRNSDYDIYLLAGQYLDRFSIVFSNQQTNLLDVDDNEIVNYLSVFYDMDSENIIINNPKLIDIDSLELFNILGQSVFYINDINRNTLTEIKTPNLNSGTYIINLKTKTSKISKKVLVK